MKASELRIGNLIDNNGKVKSVVASDFLDRKWLCFEPIIITEDWLVKFGFKKGHMIEYGDYTPYYKENFEAIYLTNHGFVYSPYRPSGEIPVKYIHQLQNLYFALTGEELPTQNTL